MAVAEGFQEGFKSILPRINSKPRSKSAADSGKTVSNSTIATNATSMETVTISTIAETTTVKP